MKVVYNGPQPARIVKFRGKSFRVERGKPVEVSAQLGEALCRQTHWQRVAAPVRQAAVKPKGPESPAESKPAEPAETKED